MWFVKLRGLLLSGANSVGYTTGPLASLLSIIALIVTREQITALEMFTILSICGHKLELLTALLCRRLHCCQTNRGLHVKGNWIDMCRDQRGNYIC